MTSVARTRSVGSAGSRVCDSLGEALDGLIEVRDLVHVYDSDGNQRGFHSAQFRWESASG